MIDLVMGAEGREHLANRIDELLINVPLELKGNRERLNDYSGEAEVAALKHAMGNLEHWASSLRELASRLHHASVIAQERDRASSNG